MRIPRSIAAGAALFAAGAAAAVLAPSAVRGGDARATPAGTGLWQVYDRSLKGARYIDLTHAITPGMPVWKGFGPATFGPAVDPSTGRPYGYASDGFEATSYRLATDQFGTQLDPPAHWAQEYPAIDELPATYAVRPLVVVSIVPQVRRDPAYALRVADIRAFEARYGSIPAGSVVMVRSDWSRRWTDDPRRRGPSRPIRSSRASRSQR